MDSIIDKLTLLNSPEYETAKKTLEFLYESLSVLDHKAEALMVFDGILIAAATFALDKGGETFHRWRRVLTLTTILLSLAAAAACLFIARIQYAFLGDITIADGKLQLTREMQALAAALADRTGDYEFAWYLSIGAVCLSVLIAFSAFFVPIHEGPHGKPQNGS